MMPWRSDVDFSVLRNRLFLEYLGMPCEVKASDVVSQILREAGLRVPTDGDEGLRLSRLLDMFDAYIAGCNDIVAEMRKASGIKEPSL